MRRLQEGGTKKRKMMSMRGKWPERREEEPRGEEKDGNSTPLLCQEFFSITRSRRGDYSIIGERISFYLFALIVSYDLI